MAYKTRKIGPPESIAKVVASLTPREYRDALPLLLITRYTSLPHYIIEAALRLWRATKRQSRLAFNPWRLLGDLCCVYIAYSAAPPGAQVMVLAVTVVGFIWRDGHSHPAEPSEEEALLDGLVLAAFLITSQAILFLVADSWIVPWPLLMPGLSMAVAMVAGWRFVLRLPIGCNRMPWAAWRQRSG